LSDAASNRLTTASAAASRPFPISQRGDSGSRNNITAMTRPGMPPIRNMICHPINGTSHAPTWPVTISPIGKIIS
jgi:hypothetical protein